jgi:hypothetical protein
VPQLSRAAVIALLWSHRSTGGVCSVYKFDARDDVEALAGLKLRPFRVPRIGSRHIGSPGFSSGLFHFSVSDVLSTPFGVHGVMSDL